MNGQVDSKRTAHSPHFINGEGGITTKVPWYARTAVIFDGTSELWAIQEISQLRLTNSVKSTGLFQLIYSILSLFLTSTHWTKLILRSLVPFLKKQEQQQKVLLHGGNDTDDGNVYLVESTCFCPEYTGFNSMTTF